MSEDDQSIQVVEQTADLVAGTCYATRCVKGKKPADCNPGYITVERRCGMGNYGYKHLYCK
jgi:hypothetical protein